MNDLGWKVNLDLWNLFINTKLNISSENNYFGSHSIQKINFSKKKSHSNVLGRRNSLNAGQIANMEGADQTASSEAVWSGSALFVYSFWAGN